MAIVDRRGVAIDSTDTPIAGDPNPGLAVKSPCRVATTANIVLAGLQTIDGVALVEGNRVLVWQQTDQTTNGLYNASSGNWTRTIDARSNDQFAAGMRVYTGPDGSVNDKTDYLLSTPDPITVGSSNLAFEKASVPSSRNIFTTAPLLGGDPLSGDITLSIAAHGISYGLMQQASASRLLGNPTGALANVAEISLGATLAFAAAVLTTVAMSGDVATAANSFATTIQPHVVSNSKFRQSAALSVVGNTSNGTADVADIAGTANQVLRVNSAGSALAFGQLNLASNAAVTGTLPSGNGGTDNATYAVGDLLQASAVTPTLSRLAAVATGNALISGGVGTVSSWGKIGLTTHVTGTLGAGNGGTGATSLGVEFTVAANVLHVANNGITYALLQQVAASSLVGNATGSLANATGITLGATLAFSGSALQTAAHTGDVTTSANSFVTTIAGGVVSLGKMANLAANSIIGNNTGSAGVPLALSASQVLDLIGATQGNVLYRGASSWAVLGPGGNNTVLIGAPGGNNPSWNATPTLTSLSLANQLTAANGGTGATSLGVEFTVAANVLHVANNGITYALLQQVAASSLVGNATGGLANATGITLGATLSFSGSSLQTAAHTGDVTTGANSFVTTVAKIAGTTVSGTTGSGKVVFDSGPVFSADVTVTNNVNAGPGGTTAGVTGKVIINGSSGSNGGASVYFQRNGTNLFAFGNSSGILGGTSDDFVIYSVVSGAGTVAAINIASSTGNVTIASGVATPAGGSTSARLLFGSTAGFGIYYGSGAPTVSAGKGSIYLRSDGSGTGDRFYVNTNASTTWTNVVTAA